MNNLSQTQKCFMLTVNGKGRIPKMNYGEIHSALYTAGVLELISGRFIDKVEDDKIDITQPLSCSHLYLKPLYNYIADQDEPQTMECLAQFVADYEKFAEYFSAIGESLVNMGFPKDDEATKMRDELTVTEIIDEYSNNCHPLAKTIFDHAMKHAPSWLSAPQHKCDANFESYKPFIGVKGVIF